MFYIFSRVGHSLILKMSDRSFFEQKMSDLENCSFFAFFERAITLYPSSLRKSERAIALFVALFERAKEQQLFWSLF